jgi:hypothetical protein
MKLQKIGIIVFLISNFAVCQEPSNSILKQSEHSLVRAKVPVQNAYSRTSDNVPSTNYRMLPPSPKRTIIKKDNSCQRIAAYCCFPITFTCLCMCCSYGVAGLTRWLDKDAREK